MTSAQIRYAQDIARWFRRHPEHGVELTTDEVLDSMNLWVDRYTQAKHGRPWLSDDARARVEAAIRDIADRVRPIRDAHDTANAALDAAIRRREDTTTLRADAKARRQDLWQAQRDACAAAVQLADSYPDEVRPEIAAIAARHRIEII